MLHEDSCRLSSYVISPRDVGVASTEETRSAQFPTAVAANPRDADQLLLAYDATSTVFLWDLAKRKVVREFTLANRKKALRRASASASSMSAGDTSSDVGAGGWEANSPQSLSWHASGKRFAVGYKHGGFAVFRADKSHGFYHELDTRAEVDILAGEQASLSLAPVKQLQWLSAPPSSKNASLAGAIVFSRGGAFKRELTLVYPPPRDVAPDDALSELIKSEQLAWHVASIPSINNAEIVDFAVASDQMDYMSKPAPLSVLVLSGNPLDGCLPSVSVQPLPCFVRFRENDKEDWEWRLEKLPRACGIPPILQLSPLTAFSVANLLCSDGALQDDLFTTWEQDKYDPLYELLASEDFEWPVNGGSMVEPLLSRFLSSSGAIKDEMQTMFQNGTLLLTGHANGFVLLWELIPPADRESKGSLRLLHTVDVTRQMSPVPETKDISCLSFCHEARVLVVGFSTGEIAVLEFGDWKLPMPTKPSPESSLAAGEVVSASQSSESFTGEAEAADTTTTASYEPTDASLNAFTGFKVLFSLHIHSQAIQHISLSTAYDYFAASDASGVVSLTQIASEAFKLVVFELPSVEEEPVSVESLLISELAQAVDLLVSVSSASDKRSKSSSTRSRQLSRGSASSAADGSFVAQHREMVPVLFVGRGNGKLEMFHVQSGAKIAESLVDPRKASSLSSIIMVDTDGRRIGAPSRAWIEQDEEIAAGLENGVRGMTATSTSEYVDSATQGTGDEDSSSPNPELEYLQQVLHEVISEQSATSSADVVLIQDEEQLAKAVRTQSSKERWTPSNVVEVTVPPGSLGLHLFTDIEQHAVVKGFVADSATASQIEASGVHRGHVIMSINGLDLTSHNMCVICGVLEKLRSREKTIVFAEGFSYLAHLPSEQNGPVRDAVAAEVEQPRFLICSCGRTIHLLQAVIPKASEMASGVREVPARPLASVELRAAVLTTSVMRVPVSARVENCLVAIDQSNHVYVLSLLSLEVVWEQECSSLGSALDGVHCEVTYGGELVVANSFGEVERFSLYSEQTAVESALMERKCIKTRLHLEERAYEFSSDQNASPKKKGGIADAGKMFKKLVTGLKDDADLHKVFHFSKAEDERAQLFRDRRASVSQAAQDDPSAVKKVEKGLGGTKDALMQATQVCVIVCGSLDLISTHVSLSTPPAAST